MDGTERKCGVCQQVKLIPPRKHKCLDCAAAKGGTAKRRAPKAKTSSYERPGGLGFRVGLEVAEGSEQTDIVVAQWNANTGKKGDWVRIWLNQLEAAELRTWLVEQLGAG